MKLSIVSGLNESKNDSEGVIKKFSSLCSLLKSLNYNGIELSLLEPEKINTTKIREVMDSYEMEISALGTGSTYLRFGVSFGDSEESIRKKALERIEKYIEFARETNSKVIIGLIRGRYKYDNSPKKERLNIISCIRKCSRTAENNNVKLLFEPINRFEIDSYNTISQSVKLLEEIDSECLKLLVDSFHTNLEEDPAYIWDDLKEIAPLVGHIHIADTTRRAPGSGHFDFKTFLNIFKNAGYDGFVSLETIMKPSFEEVAKNSAQYLRLIL